MSAPTFDAHADGYDAVAESALGRELRARVHRVVQPLLTPDSIVADLGCGTGLDAAWIAPQVASVTAVDASATMVERARVRCAAYEKATIEQGDLTTWVPGSPVNLALANFGVVNCVGPLDAFGSRLHSMLQPGGHAILVTMTRRCPIEWTIGLTTANRDLLRRRRVVGDADSAYAGLDLRYASARELAQSFGPSFELVHAEALGLVLPPFEQRRWLEHRSWLRRPLAALDQLTGSLGARLGIGDHHIAVMRAR